MGLFFYSHPVKWVTNFLRFENYDPLYPAAPICSRFKKDTQEISISFFNIAGSFNFFFKRDTIKYEMLNDFVSKLSDLENMLLPSGSDLGVFIGRFFDTLQDVASNPDSISARTVSLEAGKALASAFNSYDDQFKNFKSKTW